MKWSRAASGKVRDFASILINEMVQIWKPSISSILNGDIRLWCFLEYYSIFDSLSRKFLGSSELASRTTCYSPILCLLNWNIIRSLASRDFFPRSSIEKLWEVWDTTILVLKLLSPRPLSTSPSSFSLSPQQPFFLTTPQQQTSSTSSSTTTITLLPWRISSFFLQPATQQQPFFPEHLLWNNPPTPLYQNTTQHFSFLSYSPRRIFFPFLRKRYSNNRTNFK